MRLHASLVGLAVGGVLAVGGMGCGSDCEVGESWCSGDGTITTCTSHRPTVSSCCLPNRCRETVVDGVPTAACSPAAEADPRCAGAAVIDNLCVDGVQLHCDAGFSSNERNCANACVTPEAGVALCALEPTPDPRCADGRIRTHCDGNVIVSCAFGYAISELACVAPFETCILDRDNLGMHPRCATALPDPVCADDPPGRCSGLEIHSCSEGRRTIERCQHGCFENPIDSMFPEAFCEGPTCEHD